MSVNEPKKKRLLTALCQEQTEESVKKNQKAHVSVKKAGFLDNGTGEHQSNQVFCNSGQCPTITAIQGTKKPLKIVDKRIDMEQNLKAALTDRKTERQTDRQTDRQTVR